MGRVYNDNGFEVWIYAPPREKHRLPHVHAFYQDGEAWISLGSETVGPELVIFSGMKEKDARRALRIVEENQEGFLKEWRALHDKPKVDPKK